MGLELWRLYVVAGDDERRGIVQGGHRRRARHELALLRYHLHRTLSANTAAQSGGLRYEFAPSIRRQTRGEVPSHSRDGRRQCPRAKFDSLSDGAHQRREDIRLVLLPRQTPWHCRPANATSLV